MQEAGEGGGGWPSWDWEIERELRINAGSKTIAMMTALGMGKAMAGDEAPRRPAEASRGMGVSEVDRDALFSMLEARPKNAKPRGYLVRLVTVERAASGAAGAQSEVASLELTETELFEEPDAWGCAGPELDKLREKTSREAQARGLEAIARRDGLAPARGLRV